MKVKFVNTQREHNEESTFCKRGLSIVSLLLLLIEVKKRLSMKLVNYRTNWPQNLKLTGKAGENKLLVAVVASSSTNNICKKETRPSLYPCQVITS